jgi:hypothetical protein
LDDWSHHEDSFENYDMIGEDPVNGYNDSDQDVDYDEPNKRKKPAGKRGPGKGNGRRATSSASTEDKPFVCDKCGVKYKTKPGLSYHIQKSHGPTAASGGKFLLTISPENKEAS